MDGCRFRDADTSDGPAVREVVLAVLSEYGLCPDPATSDADLDDVVQSYFARGGTFRVLVSPAGEIVGGGGLYPLSADEAEIRKMYFLPRVRGHGFGRSLLSELLGLARARGFVRVKLETASVLKEAISLYTRFGFERVQRDHLASRCDQAYILRLHHEAGSQAEAVTTDNRPRSGGTPRRP